MSISVQEQDFDVGVEHLALVTDNARDGAVVTFTGLVRDINMGKKVSGLFLEHYPAMTQKSLQSIIDQAKERWPLGRVRVIHRVGQLSLNDQIVFVGVTSKHRQDAFDGACFIMDFLKTRAPFWKKETTEEGVNWVEARDSDEQAAKSWL